MFALIGNLDLMEVLVIALAAIMIFGKDLPEVAVKAAAQVVRLRRAVTKMWREAGIEDEIRRVQREIEHAKPRVPPIDSLVSDADRRRAERARELRELTPRPELEQDPESAGQRGGSAGDSSDGGWVRGEGDVDDAFQPDPAESYADPFAARREPDSELGSELGSEPASGEVTDVPPGEDAEDAAAGDEGQRDPSSEESGSKESA